MTARGTLRGGVRVALFVLVLALIAVVLLQVWARDRFRRYGAEWQADLEAERARIAALRMPVLVGAPADCNAADRYLPILESFSHSGFPDGRPSGAVDPLIKDFATITELGKAAGADPFEALPGKLEAILDAHEAKVAALREATRCDRVDWRFPYERGFDAPIPSLLAARTMANLTVLGGHRRARAGDIQGAVEDYFVVMRFGADFETQGVLITSLIGVAIRGIGQDGLGALLSRGERARLPLVGIATALDRLDAIPSSVAAGLRGERLGLLPSMKQGFGGAPVVEYLGGRPLIAHALGELLPAYREVERAAGEADVQRAFASLEPRLEAVAASRNPITTTIMPSMGRAASASVRMRARHALLKAAQAAEAAGQKDGAYPAALATAPQDPYALPATVHYRVEANGAGYTVWSVGMNGKDDGGVGGWRGNQLAEQDKDIVLSRIDARSPRPGSRAAPR